MKIVNLVENTEGKAGCRAEHGLCFYIETKKHKILMDTGQTDLVIENAQKLGVDLTKVDIAFLSHGHYDHSGGIIPFSKINDKAKIYIKEDAFGDYYSTTHGPEPVFIGVDPQIRELKQVCIINGDMEIDDELSVFADIGNNRQAPLTNKRLFKKENGELVNDDFTHEQCLVIKQEGKSFLFSGCAHHGILNILDRYKEIYSDEPDYVFSGFHTMRKTGYSDEDKAYIEKTANELMNYKSKFYTCHCTGVEPYEIMKEILKDKIEYVHCGDVVDIDIADKDDLAAKTTKKGGNYMKWHKFFAWATVVCFIMCMITGYKRK
ncbi:MAG: MBL fold metallo-hydrolase [Butyrivibrio sp.]|nr:MBL fold metallo-hydrolase [Butyrivibrio sp.]